MKYHTYIHSDDQIDAVRVFHHQGLPIEIFERILDIGGGPIMLAALSKINKALRQWAKEIYNYRVRAILKKQNAEDIFAMTNIDGWDVPMPYLLKTSAYHSLQYHWGLLSEWSGDKGYYYQCYDPPFGLPGTLFLEFLQAQEVNLLLYGASIRRLKAKAEPCLASDYIADSKAHEEIHKMFGKSEKWFLTQVVSYWLDGLRPNSGTRFPPLECRFVTWSGREEWVKAKEDIDRKEAMLWGRRAAELGRLTLANASIPTERQLVLYTG